MGFGNVWSQSWKSYKLNAGSTSSIMAWYYLLPLLILGIGVVVVLFGTGLTSDLSHLSVLGEEATAEDLPSGFLVNIFLLFFVALIGGIAFFFISFMGYGALIKGYLQGKRFSADDALKEGKKIYWKLMGLTALLGLLVLGVEVIVIVGVVLSVILAKIAGSILLGTLLVLVSVLGLIVLGALVVGRLVLSLYVLADENTGVWASMKKSWNITRGKSWAMVGYMVITELCMMLVIYGLMFIVALICMPFISLEEAFTATSFSQGLIIFEIILNVLVQPVFALVLMPWIISFFREVYAEYSVGKKSKGKRQL